MAQAAREAEATAAAAGLMDPPETAGNEPAIVSDRISAAAAADD